MGHFAEVCKSRTVSRIKEESVSDSQTESWPKIDPIQSVNSIIWFDFYKAIQLVQGQPIELIIDTGYPVTIIPPLIDPLELQKTTKCFVDVNKNPIKLKGEATVDVKTKKCRKTLPILITENKNTQQLRGLDSLQCNCKFFLSVLRKSGHEISETETRALKSFLERDSWLDKLKIGLQGNENTNIIRHIETDGRREKIVNQYENLFKNNHAIKDLTIGIHLKQDSKPIQQKRQPVHFQKTVKQVLEKLIKKGHLEKADKTTMNCFISLAFITIKKDKLVKIALDSRKLNEACVERKAAMPNMEERISKISTEITESDDEIRVSKIDLDYAYGQAKLSKEAARHCVFSIFEGRLFWLFPF